MYINGCLIKKKKLYCPFGELNFLEEYITIMFQSRWRNTTYTISISNIDYIKRGWGK